jgi:adenylyltransferase/sulfurtransferase
MYSRFEALKEFGEEEQKQLQNSTAAVVGLGATGSAIAENLARHGVNLIIVDRDYLEQNDVYSSNLYTIEQCSDNLPKAEAAEKKLGEFTEVKSHSRSLSHGNLEILENADIVLDGTDNMRARQLINGFSQREDVPWVYTAALGRKAYSMFFDKKCFRCLVQDVESAASCESRGVMRETAQKAAASSSLKAVKFLAGKKVSEKLGIVHEARKLDAECDGCKVCEEKWIPETGEEAVELCGEGKYMLERDFESISTPGEVVSENGFLKRIEFQGTELTVFHSGRIFVEAEDEGHAKALVAKALEL